MKNTEVLDIKIDIIMQGLSSNETAKEIYELQNPDEVWKTGYSNGIFLNIGEFKVNTGFNSESQQDSPYTIEKINNTYILFKNGLNTELKCVPMKMPDFTKKVLSNGDRFSKYFVYEGDGYLHIAYKSCAFSEEDMCKFCGVERGVGDGNKNDPSADEIIRILSEVIEEIPTHMQFCLGGGTYFPFERNVEFFSKIASFIRSKGNYPIWVEMIPPTKEDIKILVDNGVSAFGFNIEIYNKEQREFICPGKGKISLDHYYDSYEYASSLLGKDKVGCCLIVGLDTVENVKLGIDELVSHNVHPCILPLKIVDNSPIASNTSSYSVVKEDFLELSMYAAKKMIESNLSLNNNFGCLNCPCCNVQHDCERELTKLKQKS